MTDIEFIPARQAVNELHIHGQGTMFMNPWKVDLDIPDLSQMNANQRDGAIKALNFIRDRIEDAWHATSYGDGESSGHADWAIALSEVDVPDDVDKWSPTSVAQWIGRLLVRQIER